MSLSLQLARPLEGGDSLPAEQTPPDVTRLVEANVQLVGYLVSERLSKVPAHVNRDDLTSAGMLALVVSARAYEPERGIPFARFAAIRIRGALIDELRSMDWATRLVRTRAREMETLRAQLTSTLGRSPAHAEIARAMGITDTDLDNIHSDLVRANLLSLQGFSSDVLDGLRTEVANGPEALLLHREQLGYLHDAVSELPERLRFLVFAYFFEQRQMNDIARELGVTESRVSQLCTEAMSLLRDGINAQLDPAALSRAPQSRRAAKSRNAYFGAIASRGTVASRLSRTSANGEMLPAMACTETDLSQERLSQIA